MSGRVAQSAAAELDGGGHNPVPEGPNRRGDPELDAGTRVPARQIIDDHLVDGIHRLAALWPKNRSRSARVVVDAGQMQPRGQSLGNQKIGACRRSTAHTNGGAGSRDSRPSG